MTAPGKANFTWRLRNRRQLWFSSLLLAFVLHELFANTDYLVGKIATLWPDAAHPFPIIVGPHYGRQVLYATPTLERIYEILEMSWVVPPAVATVLILGLYCDSLRAGRCGSDRNILQDWSGRHAVAIDRAMQIGNLWVGISIFGGIILGFLIYFGILALPAIASQSGAIRELVLIVLIIGGLTSFIPVVYAVGKYATARWRLWAMDRVEDWDALRDRIAADKFLGGYCLMTPGFKRRKRELELQYGRLLNWSD